MYDAVRCVSNVAVGNETSSKTVFKRSTMKVEFSGGSESITNNNNNFNTEKTTYNNNSTNNPTFFL